MTYVSVLWGFAITLSKQMILSQPSRAGVSCARLFHITGEAVNARITVHVNILSADNMASQSVQLRSGNREQH
jgi:hypothetical protein